MITYFVIEDDDHTVVLDRADRVLMSDSAAIGIGSNGR